MSEKSNKNEEFQLKNKGVTVIKLMSQLISTC